MDSTLDSPRTHNRSILRDKIEFVRDSINSFKFNHPEIWPIIIESAKLLSEQKYKEAIATLASQKDTLIFTNASDFSELMEEMVISVTQNRTKVVCVSMHVLFWMIRMNLMQWVLQNEKIITRRSLRSFLLL